MEVFGITIKPNKLFKPKDWMLVSELKDKWEVIVADGITVAQGYKCRRCGLIYGNRKQCICKD